MHCGHKEGCCMRHQCSDRIRKDDHEGTADSIATLRRAIRRFFASTIPLCVALAFQFSDVKAQIVSSPRDLAVIRINLLDVLAHEPNLPLPIRQRREALEAYYQNFGGELLWLASSRTNTFISRLKNAEADGLDPNDYPSKQLETLSATGPSNDKRGLAIVELYFSSAFLEYASDLKVGRFLPSKIDPNFFIEGRTIDQLSALKDLAQTDSIDRFFDAWQPAGQRYAALRTVLAKYRALAAKGGWSATPLGDAIRPGMTDPRVPAIRARISMTDGASSAVAATEATLYDNAMDAREPGATIPDRQHSRLRAASDKRRKSRRTHGSRCRQALSPNPCVQ